MTIFEVTHLRQQNQLITQHPFQKPEEVVQWLGAVQAQEYLHSLWAIGLRLPYTSEAGIEGAIADKAILRTWPMRGTIHFVPPADARWMLKLLTPRVVARTAGRYRQFGLDSGVFARSSEVLAKALEGGKQLTRTELYQVLERSNISTANSRGLQILGQLAQEGLLCFGPRRGKQPTFVLLDEWVPAPRMLERDEALAELARRYFRSHGPATVQDFAWWSGLPVAEAGASIDLIRQELVQENFGSRAYWLSPSALPIAKTGPPTAHLLPPFDEYTVAYKDRSHILDPAVAEQRKSDILNAAIAMDGQIIGTWTRAFNKGAARITTSLFQPELTAAERDAIEHAARRYAAFLGMPVVLK
jgi:hypothetical protein